MMQYTESPGNVNIVFITFPCKEAMNGKLILFVDTEADFSKIKEE